MKKLTFRLTAMLICLVMLIGVLPLAVFAASEMPSAPSAVKKGDDLDYYILDADLSVLGYDLDVAWAADGIYLGRNILSSCAKADKYTEAYDVLCETLASRLSASQNISYLGLTEGELDAIARLFYYDHLEDYVMKYPWATTSKFYIEYYEGFDEAAYERNMAEILKVAECKETEYDKALAVHDYLARHVNYVLRATNAHTSYGAVVDKEAVCEGYAYAYQDALHRMGIFSYFVPSASHAWNLVRLDGTYCYVDVTWDDPTSDPEGAPVDTYAHVYHAYFGLSAELMFTDRAHTPLDTSLLPTNTENKFYDKYTFVYSVNDRPTESKLVKIGNILEVPFFYLGENMNDFISDCFNIVRGSLPSEVRGNGYSATIVGSELCIYSNLSCTHSYTTVAECDSTTTEHGWYEYQVCSGCGMLMDKEGIVLNEIPYKKLLETSVEDEFGFAKYSLTLQSDLQINFKVKKNVLGAFENVKAVFTMDGESVEVSNYTESDDYYVFVCSNIAPHKIGDDVTAVLYGDYNGVSYESEPIVVGVQTYCYALLNNETYSRNVKLRTLLVDLLNYCTEVQKYIGRTENFANATLTETQRGWASADRTLVSVANSAYATVENPEASWTGVGLYLRDRIAVRVKLHAEDITGVSVRFSTDDGRYVNIREFVPAGDNEWYVYMSDLDASEMSEVLYITAYRGDEAISNTMRYSIESYAYAAQNSSSETLSNLVKAMMRYGDSAKNYIN